MKDQRQLTPTLYEIFKNQDSALAWSLEFNSLKHVNLTTQKITKDFMFFGFEDSFKALLEPLISVERKLKIHFPKSGLFVLAYVKESSNNNIITSHPIIHEFEDRRKVRRNSLEGNLQVRFFNDKKQVLLKNISDISGGGFSVILMKSEANPFKNSQMIDVEIEELGLKEQVEIISDEKIELYKWEDAPYGGTRLSFKFCNSSDRFKELLNVFIDRYRTAGM